VLQLVI